MPQRYHFSLRFCYNKRMANRNPKSKSKTRRRNRKRQQIKRRNAFRVVKFFVLVALIVALPIIAFNVMVHSNGHHLPLSSEVKSYEDTIRECADRYGIGRYDELIEAVMMQESHGKGGDPMQSSEGNYNKKYPKSPGGITDPYYSIDCGVHQLAEDIDAAGCHGPRDMKRIKLAIQGYNFGNGYITWAVKNYGGYSEENAAEFSSEMAAGNGSNGYGDPKYVEHVIRYYKYK